MWRIGEVGFSNAPFAHRFWRVAFRWLCRLLHTPKEPLWLMLCRRASRRYLKRARPMNYVQ